MPKKKHIFMPQKRDSFWGFLDNDEDAVENSPAQLVEDDDDDDGEVTTSDDLLTEQNDEWGGGQAPKHKKTKGMVHYNITSYGCHSSTG